MTTSIISWTRVDYLVVSHSHNINYLIATRLLSRGHDILMRDHTLFFFHPCRQAWLRGNKKISRTSGQKMERLVSNISKTECVFACERVCAVIHSPARYFHFNLPPLPSLYSRFKENICHGTQLTTFVCVSSHGL